MLSNDAQLIMYDERENVETIDSRTSYSGLARAVGWPVIALTLWLVLVLAHASFLFAHASRLSSE